MPRAKPSDCTCTYNFTCGACLRRIVWHFTPSTASEIVAREVAKESKADKPVCKCGERYCRGY